LKEKETWMSDYNRGTAEELYFRKFSAHFYGMNFTEACQFCYVRLHIVLLAVQQDPQHTLSFPIFNAGDDFHILEDTFGFFLADHREEVGRYGLSSKQTLG
jgi:Calcium-activated BK potassium channel alpha subunit